MWCASVGRSMACDQMGRLVQYCTSRPVPMAPASIHSRICRVPSRACPWFPIWVATPLVRAMSASARASATVRVSGFSQYMLAAAHRLHRDDRVGVVQGGNDDRIDVRFAVQHLAVVGVGGRLGILIERRSGVAGVHIAERHDILAAARLHIRPSAPADPQCPRC